MDINKTNDSHKCKIYHYNYFFSANISFQSNICNGCHNLWQKTMRFEAVKLQLFL